MKTRIPSISSSEITPESVYLSRRKALRLGGIGLSAAALAACGIGPSPTAPGSASPSTNPAIGPQLDPSPTPDAREPAAGKQTDELGDKLTPFASVTGYNNFYEFSTSKESVAGLSKNFKGFPWTVTVGGLVAKPRTYDLDDLRKRFDPEERIYRLRCVEAWSMVIPWVGFALNKLLKEVEPTSKAKFVRFESLYDTTQFPGQRDPFYRWPYVEGLRLDEAMNDLTLMVTGLYGKALPGANGAPLRLAVPWKYGFKSIKSIVKIDLVEEQPTSLWMSAAANEYGFYSNVNPGVSHPRWLQDTERRIGELARRRTLMFNGYEAQVQELYKGMDLKRNY